MSPLHSILATYRATSQSEREKGSYFEELIRNYFRCVVTINDLRENAKNVVCRKRTPSFAFKQRWIGAWVKRDHALDLMTSRTRPGPHCIFN